MNSCYINDKFSTKSGAARAAPAAPLLTALFSRESNHTDQLKKLPTGSIIHMMFSKTTREVVKYLNLAVLLT